jgi:DNA-binding NtrC family response regulator
MRRNKTILLIDTDREFHLSSKQYLENAGFLLQSAYNASEGIGTFEDGKFDLALVNYDLPEMNGLELFKRITAKPGQAHALIPFILMLNPSAEALPTTGLLDAGIKMCLKKPFGHQELINIIENIMIQSSFHDQIKNQVQENKLIIERLSLENQQLKSELKQNYNFENIIGTTPPMLEILDKISKIAKTDVNIFIYGENGTGKELIARSIHAHSRRNQAAFVACDCKALPAQLMEMELFGAEQEASLLMPGPKIGNLNLANHGTLFFDEICELNPDLQAKLLRTIQEKQFRPCSSCKIFEADLRIISASTRVPEKAVSENQLREDLYYRLNVIPIKLPPLRERKADIPLLIGHFIKLMHQKNSEHPVRFSPEALRLLKNYHWPGNVRELQNVIERVVSLAGNALINPEDLPDHILHNSELHSFLPAPDLPLKEARKKWMEKFERNYLIELLNRCNGNISEVARVAQSNRMTVYRMIKNYHISTRKYTRK